LLDLEPGLDRLLDVLDSHIASRPLRPAPPKSGDVRDEAAVFSGLQNYLQVHLLSLAQRVQSAASAARE
jgi:hypothetical protein